MRLRETLWIGQKQDRHLSHSYRPCVPMNAQGSPSVFILTRAPIRCLQAQAARWAGILAVGRTKQFLVLASWPISSLIDHLLFPVWSWGVPPGAEGESRICSVRHGSHRLWKKCSRYSINKGWSLAFATTCILNQKKIRPGISINVGFPGKDFVINAPPRLWVLLPAA